MRESSIIYIQILVGSLFMILLISCGGESMTREIAKVSPERAEISGDLSDYLRVVENEYEVIDDWGGHLSIKLEALRPLDSEKLINNDLEVSAFLLGENGIPLSDVGEFKVSQESIERLSGLLKRGSGEEIIQLSVMIGQYEAEIHADKAKKFSVRSVLKEKDKESLASVNEVSEETGSISNSNLAKKTDEDWDKILDSYEEYVDQYIRFYKKALGGDLNAISEYTGMMEKATQLFESINEAQNDNELDERQIKRLMEIQNKMLQVASGG